MTRAHFWFGTLAVGLLAGALLLTASITRAAPGSHPNPAASSPAGDRTVYAQLATGTDPAALPGIADGAVVLVAASGSEALTTRALRLGVTLALALGLAGSAATGCLGARAPRSLRTEDVAPRTQSCVPRAEPSGLGTHDSGYETARAQAGGNAAASCARAVAAAFMYNRAATLAAFATAIALDPDVNPTAIPGFWEMPASGHVDLARAYLRHGRSLDARSVVTVALLTFRHHRELEELLHETAHRLAS